MAQSLFENDASSDLTDAPQLPSMCNIYTSSTPTSSPFSASMSRIDCSEVFCGNPLMRTAEKSLGRRILDTRAPASNWTNAPPIVLVKSSFLGSSYNSLLQYSVSQCDHPPYHQGGCSANLHSGRLTSNASLVARDAASSSSACRNRHFSPYMQLPVLKYLQAGFAPSGLAAGGSTGLTFPSCTSCYME